MWLALHLQRLVGYRNRFEVLSSWAWNYVTTDRTARLMIGSDDDRPHHDRAEGAGRG
jgi:NADH dehydrogenase